MSDTTILLFNGTEKSWKFYPELSNKVELVGLKYAAAVHLVGNKFMLCGGLSGGEPCKLACIVDIKKVQGQLTDDSSLIQELTHCRMQHSLVVYQGHAYVIGGQSSKEQYLNSVERWEDPNWVLMPGLLTARSTFAAVANDCGIYVAGGYTGPNSICGNIEKFTVGVGAWVALPIEFPQLAGMTGVRLPNPSNEFLLLGGSDGVRPTRTVLRLNSDDDSINKELNELVQPRAKAIAVRCRGEVYVFGGGITEGERWLAGRFESYAAVPLLPPYQWVTMPYIGDPNR